MQVSGIARAQRRLEHHLEELQRHRSHEVEQVRCQEGKQGRPPL